VAILVPRRNPANDCFRRNTGSRVPKEPKGTPNRIKSPGKAENSTLSAINFEAGKFNALYSFDSWETIFLRLPGD
jgi:hypothetical protein